MAKVERIGNQYRIRWYDAQGDRHQRSFDTEREAERHGEAMRTQVREGRFLNPKRGKQTVDEWTAELFEINALLAPQTLATDESLYRNHVQPTWGKMALARVDRTGVERWIASLSQSLAPSSVVRTYGVFRKIILAAVDHDKIARSPLPRRPRLPRVTGTTERYLTEQEVEHLADFMPDRYRAIVFIGCYGGFRPQEIAALRLNDIDWIRSTIRVDEAMIRDVDGAIVSSVPKTPGSERYVAINDTAMEELRAHVEKFVGWDDKTALIFTGDKGGVVLMNNWRNRLWYPTLDAAGIERMRPYDMRHTACSFWISDGASPLLVARQLGHTDTRMIDRVYGHLFDKDIQALRDRSSERAARGRAEKPAKGSIIPLRPQTAAGE